jgi:hypothetical protein
VFSSLFSCGQVSFWETSYVARCLLTCGWEKRNPLDQYSGLNLFLSSPRWVKCRVRIWGEDCSWNAGLGVHLNFGGLDGG